MPTVHPDTSSESDKPQTIRQFSGNTDGSQASLASRFICHADDVIHPGSPVVLHARVSGRTQARQRSLDRQIAGLKADAARLGADIVGTCLEVASGMSPDRPVLTRAAALARRHNAIILDHNVGRLIRSAEFHRTRNPGAQPTQAEYEGLVRAVGGVTLATVLPPDTDWREVRAAETRRGKRATKPRMSREERAHIISILSRDVIRYHWSRTAREFMRATRRYPTATAAADALIRLGCRPSSDRPPGRGRGTILYYAPMAAVNWWWNRRRTADTIPRRRSRS